MNALSEEPSGATMYKPNAHVCFHKKMANYVAWLSTEGVLELCNETVSEKKTDLTLCILLAIDGEMVVV